MNRIKYAIALVSLLALGVFTAAAVAGNGHGNKPGDDTTAECQPAYGGESCVHNGDGHGNCGDNRGKGSHGNDNGFGHKRDACQAAATTTTTSSRTTTVTTPASTVTTTTPGQTTTVTTPSGGTTTVTTPSTSPPSKTAGPPVKTTAPPATPVKTPANFTG